MAESHSSLAFRMFAAGCTLDSVQILCHLERKTLREIKCRALKAVAASADSSTMQPAKVGGSEPYDRKDLHDRIREFYPGYPEGTREQLQYWLENETHLGHWVGGTLSTEVKIAWFSPQAPQVHKLNIEKQPARPRLR